MGTTHTSQLLLGITDIHIKTQQDGAGTRLALDAPGSLVFPDARTPDESVAPVLAELLVKSQSVMRDDFMVEVDGVFFRGRRDAHAVDGTWLRLRKMADEPPNLDCLPSPMPAPIKQALMAPELNRGGIVLVSGGPGCGKTTSASAVLVSRLMAYGGMAYTVEDPPEMPLNGRHGSGYCTQTTVAGDKTADWVESMRGVLRSQPVGTNLILFVGEVRDAEAARMMVRAASNGFLVLCTTFASDICSAIDTYYQLLGVEFTQSLASMLRITLYQRILDGRFSVECLTSDGAGSKVAAIIRSRQMGMLRDEVTFQRNALLTGRPLFASSAAHATTAAQAH